MKITCEKCGYEITIEDRLLLEEGMSFSCPSCNGPINVGGKKPSLEYEDSSEMETQLLSKKSKEEGIFDPDTMIRDKNEEEEERTHEGPQYEISDSGMTSDTKEKPEEPVAFSLKNESLKSPKPESLSSNHKNPSGKVSAPDRDSFLPYEKTEVSEKKAVAFQPWFSVTVIKEFFASKKGFLPYLVPAVIIIISLLYPLFAVKKQGTDRSSAAEYETDPLIIRKFSRYFDFDSQTGRELSIKLLEGAVEKESNDIKLKSALAIAYADSGNFLSDRDALRKSLEISAGLIAEHPESPDAYRAMAIYYMDDPEMSAKYLNKALRIDSRLNLGLKTLDHYLKANIKTRNGDIDGAIESLRQGVSADPESLRVLRMLSQLHSLKRDDGFKTIDSKIASLEEEYYRNFPELRSEAYPTATLSPSIPNPAGPTVTATPDPGKKAKLKAWESSFEKAKRLFFESNYLDAEKSFLASIKDYKRLNPKLTRSEVLSNIYSMLGQTYDRLYKTDEALNAYRKAVANNPKNPNAHKGLAVIYETKIGDEPKALKEYKEYLKHSPDAPDKEEILEIISSLQK